MHLKKGGYFIIIAFVFLYRVIMDVLQEKQNRQQKQKLKNLK